MSDKINDTEKIEDVEEKVENTTDNKVEKTENKSVFSTRNKVLVGIIGALCVSILVALGIYTEQKVSLKENYGGVPIMKAEQSTVRKNETFFKNAMNSNSLHVQIEDSHIEKWVNLYVNQETLTEPDLRLTSADAAYAVLEGSLSSFNISEEDLKDITYTFNEQHSNEDTYRFDQNYKGVHVLGGSFILGTEGPGILHNLGGITGYLMKMPAPIDVTPKVAIDTVLKNANLTDKALSTELAIDFDTLVWLVETEDSFIEYSAVDGSEYVVSEKGEHWGE